MEPLLLEGGTVCTPGGPMAPGWVLVEGGLVRDVGAGPAPRTDARRLDLAGATITPGLIDLHLHGALGRDAMDATVESLAEMACFCARHGVTGYLPTLMAAPTVAIVAALRAAERAMAADTGGARVLGAHLESPYLAPEKVGAQDARHVRSPSPEEVGALLSSPALRVLTIAPEMPGAEDVILRAREAGVVVSAGHTVADVDAMARAVALGVRNVTHLYNGMGGFHHRAPGTVGAALTMDELTCELVADNIHVHPAALKLAVRAKGIERIALVSDAMRGTGMPDGDYDLGSQRVLVRGGVARLADGTLAGSTLTLDRAVRHVAEAAGLGGCEAVRMASETPARVLGLEGRRGTIAPGMDADLAVWDAGWRAVLTLVGGRVVHDAR